MKPIEEAMRVVLAVSQVTGASPSQIAGKRRFYDYSRAKFMVTRLLKDLHPRWPVSKLSILLECDHSTVIHRLKRADAMLSNEEDFKEDYDAAKSQLLEPCQT